MTLGKFQIILREFRKKNFEILRKPGVNSNDVIKKFRDEFENS